MSGRGRTVFQRRTARNVERQLRTLFTREPNGSASWPPHGYPHTRLIVLFSRFRFSNDQDVVMTLRITYVAGSTLLLVGLLLYVPYEVEALYPADGRTATETEYRLYGNPPESDGVYRIGQSAQAETEELAIQFGVAVVVVAGVGFAVFLVSRSENPEGPRRNSRRGVRSVRGGSRRRGSR